jgi:hypothetical protein
LNFARFDVHKSDANDYSVLGYDAVSICKVSVVPRDMAFRLVWNHAKDAFWTAERLRR